MAEEEILTEQVVAPKKVKESGGGGSPIMIIVAVVVALVVVAFILINKMGGISKTVEEQVNDLKSKEAQTQSLLKGRLAPEECTIENKAAPFKLTASADGKTSEPITLNLKDGHYIRTKITICVEEGVTKEAIEEQKDALLFVVTEIFNRKTVNDILTIEGAPAKAEKAAPAEGSDESASSLSVEDEMGEPEGGMEIKSGSKLNALREDILSGLRNFKSLKIKDVYLPELIVDVGS